MEDAWVAYLSSVLPGEVTVFAAMSRDALTFPCCIVTVLSNDNPNEAAPWNRQRLMEMEIKLAVEAKDEKDSAGNVAQSLRQRNAELRQAVLEAVTATDIAAKINDTGIVRISLATIGAIKRGVEGRVMETIIPIAVLT